MLKAWPNTQEYQAPLPPLIEALKQARQDVEDAAFEKDLADDLVTAADVQRDYEVKELHRGAMSWDEKKPTRRVLTSLFPSGRFSDITDLRDDLEPRAVKDLIARLQELPDDHPLREFIERLEVANKHVEDNLNAAAQKAELLSKAETREEIAKAEVRSAYEKSYVKLREGFGKKGCEKFFPTINRNERKEQEPESDGS